MEFGSVPVESAVGGILAHSVAAAGTRLRKGRVLDAAACAALHAAGVEMVILARPAPGDVGEDLAARRVAEAAAGAGLRVAEPITGRCNLHAEADGLLRVDAAAIDAANAVDEALTLATPRDFERLRAGQLAATAKVIPYAAARSSVETVCARLERGQPALRLHPFHPMRVTLILTETAAQNRKLAEKGAEAVAGRVRGLGAELIETAVCAHETAALSDCLDACGTAAPDAVLILAASATSDRRDVAPAAIVASGGEIERFGMPVDPGNLLVLAHLAGRRVIVLPGCARSPALNGADWVLERMAARIPITGADIAAMGVGGLLKEIPTRPQPREAR